MYQKDDNPEILMSAYVDKKSSRRMNSELESAGVRASREKDLDDIKRWLWILAFFYNLLY